MIPPRRSLVFLESTKPVTCSISSKAIGNASAVLGNSMDASSEPAFLYLDISDLGYTSVIETYVLIPREIRPEEPLPAKFLKGTVWEAAKVPLGLASILVAVPIFFGMPAVETNIHDSDFEEKLAQLSPTHLAWAKLVRTPPPPVRRHHQIAASVRDP